MAQADDDADAARPAFEDAARGLERLGTPLWAGHALAGVAWCDWRDGLLDDAADKYRQVHEAGGRLGEPTLVATGLEGLARVSAAESRNAEAAELLQQADQLRQAAARPAPPHERRELELLRTRLAAATSVSLNLSTAAPEHELSKATAAPD
jgi:hypothetical protein